MTQQILERTVREWVQGNPARGARSLSRLDATAALSPGQSVEEIIDALVRFAGRMDVAETRAW